MPRELFKWDQGSGESQTGDSNVPSPGGDIVGEGPGIDIVNRAVKFIGIGGDTILLYHADLSPVSEYAASDAGLIAALAAMVDYDVLEIPQGIISGGPWTVAQGLIYSNGGVLDGELTVMSGAQADKISVIRSEDDAGTIYGIILDAGAVCHDGFVDITNATGDAVGIYGMDDAEGDCHAYDMIVHVDAGGDGRDYKTGGPNLYAHEGRAVATTAPVG